MTSPIQAITLREIRLPLREPFVTAHGVIDDRRIVLLEMADGDGCRAWSECVALAEPSYFPDTVDTAWLAIREWIAPRILGRTFEAPTELHRELAAAIRGHQMPRAAVEMGAWGLAARRRGVSLAELLGGTRSEVETGVAVGVQASREELVAKVREAVAEGYPRIKLKIRPGADFEPLRAVRETVGGEVALIADANSAYTLADAGRLTRLDALGLLMIEQPLAWDDLVRHAELQRRMATPICLDESITGLARAEDMVALGSGRIVSLKPGRVGGLSEALAIHDLCRRCAVPLWCGGMLESGIGRAYNVALASLPGFTLAGDLSPSARYWARDVVIPEWTMNGRGRIAVPRDTAGIGVDVDVDRIDDLTVRREDLAASRGRASSSTPSSVPPKAPAPAASPTGRSPRRPA